MLRQTKDGITLAVRAQSGAKRTGVVGVYGDGASAQLKVAVNAPPIEGRANDALIAFLADTFGLPRNAIELTSGASSRRKAFLLRGISLANAQVALSKLLTR